MAFARAVGASRGELLEYRTSRDVHPAESFVGYAAVAYRKEP
jgi:AmmeMemoRadiSam system protein B